ncbi:MAG: DUF5011 domain-containing protein [Candidatus Hydrogenedentes bacterium]|nr:DUF5011 domain-containing protein [Candidatus Hydrogenedentota bacterium]
MASVHFSPRALVARALYLGVLGLCGAIQPAQGAVFFVNSFGDEGDAVPGDGVAETMPGTGITTLRAAIEEANAFPGPDTIRWSLVYNQTCRDCPTHCVISINVTRPLPPLADPTGGTTIEGFSGHLIGTTMDPSLGEPGFNAALVIQSANNVVSGVRFRDFPQDGIVISGPNATGNLIQGVTIGKDACTLVTGVRRHGIVIENGASGNVIRGVNVVRSGGYGIVMTGEGTEGNTVVSSHLGQDPEANLPVCGIIPDDIEGSYVPIVPNHDPCDWDHMNAWHLKYVTSSHKPNTLGNILIEAGASNNTIGGAGRENRNYFGGAIWTSRHTLNDPFEFCDRDLLSDRPLPASGQTPGETPLFSNGDDTGITIQGAGTSGNRVINSDIGYRNVPVLDRVIDGDFNGFHLYPGRDMNGNGRFSIWIRDGATGNIIGDPEDPELGNRISFSYRDAIRIEGENTRFNGVYNNFISAEDHGVNILNGAKENHIGGPGAENHIRARDFGVVLQGAGTENNIVQGNRFDSNGFSGMAVFGGASNNLIGGAGPGEGNRFILNCSDGVVLYEADTRENRIFGNEISRSGEIGVFVVGGASDNFIGGPEPGQGNDIHSNFVTGVEIHDVSSTNNRILGNDIHNNETRGVFMVDGTSGNIVGGESLPERNRIFENGRAGIEINGAATERNQIRINSIFNNDEKGILLSFGANQGITPPVIDRFIPFSGSAAPNSLVDIFADDAEEGRDYIGGTMADAEGSYTIALDLLPYLNRNLTTTATDVDGNTSEFSLPISIIPPVFTDEPGDVVIVEGDDLLLPMVVEGAPEIALSWRFRAPGGGYEPVIANDFFSGVDTEALLLENGQFGHEGHYQCIADNGLGEVFSREVYVRVVVATLDTLDVNTLNDVADGNTSSIARLLASPGEDGLVSLREAILAANSMPGRNTVRFGVEGAIQLETPLPAIGDGSGGLVLDGGGTVALDGGLLEGSGSGLTIESAENTIRNLSIYGFPEHGILIEGPNAFDNAVVACRIGNDGAEPLPNRGHGIALSGGARDNAIGGAHRNAANLIAGNANAGVAISGAGTTGNRVIGNTIGEPGDGTLGGGNGIAGVYVFERASENWIGGGLPEEGNHIGGNTGIGVYVAGVGTSGNTIRNNSIHDNGDLGIRLFEGGNDMIARPAITGIDPIVGTAPPGCTVDFYSDLEDEGRTPLFSIVAGEGGTFEAPADLTNQEGTYLTATATDASGNTSAFSAPVPIDFTPPVLALNGPDRDTQECGTPHTDPGVTATDNFDGDLGSAVVVEITDGAGAPVETLSEAAPGEYTVRYTVSDRAGLAATPVSRRVRVEDTIPPVVAMNGPDVIEVACTGVWEDPGATATDSCGAAEWTVSGSVDTNTPGSYELIYRATDEAGNVSEPAVRTVVVTDSTSPVITLIGEATLDAECGAPWDDPGAVAVDDCGGEITVRRSGSVNTSRPGVYTLTYNATDLSGNAAEAVTRTVTVADRTPPALVLNGDAEVTITCGAGYAERGATLTDACEPGTEVRVSGDLNPNVAGVYTIFYDATDAAGNAAETIIRTVTVIGARAPEIFLTGEARVIIPCEAPYADAGARAYDGCDTDITASIEVDGLVYTTAPGEYTLTYRVRDGAGVPAEPVSRTVTVLPCVEPCDAQCNGDPDDAIDEDGDGLSRCREACIGTSDRNPDSDGDGMPDGFEYRYRLDPGRDDSGQDPDADGSTNIEEFLEGGSPRDPASPRRIYFVSPGGSDRAEAGTRANPWKTVAYAIGRVSPSADRPVRIFLEAGVYEERVTVKPHTELRSNPGASVEIVGSVVLREASALQGITLSSLESDAGIVFVEGTGAAVRDSVISGERAPGQAGVVIEAGAGAESEIEGVLFDGLDTGIDVFGTLPAVRHCRFTNIATAAIRIRAGAGLPRTGAAMGQGLNGWNEFGVTGGGLAIQNETGTVVSAQWNDWGTTSASGRQALVSGTVNQAKPLTPGAAPEVAALDVVVFSGANQARIPGARVTISGAGISLEGTTNPQGHAAFPALAPGSWEIVVSAGGYPEHAYSASLPAGERHVVSAPLLRDEPAPAPGSCPPPAAASAPAGARGDFLLLGLIVGGLFIGRRLRWRSSARGFGDA